MSRLLRLAAMAGALLVTSAPVSNAQPDPIRPFTMSWAVTPPFPCVRDTIRLRFQWCEECVHVVSIERIGELAARVVFEPRDILGCTDPDSCPPDIKSLLFGLFPVGLHDIDLELVARLPDGGGTRDVIEHVLVRFAVEEGCEPPHDGLPFVDRIIVRGRDGGPACEGESLQVHVSGHFPDDCHILRKAELQQVVCIADPCLPILRLLVDATGCVRRLCRDSVFTFEAHLTMPPLRAGPYGLAAQLSVVSCADTFPLTPDFTTVVPFGVLPESLCQAPPRACLLPAWDAPPDLGCDAFIADDRPAHLTFGVRSTVALAALQGRFALDSPALRITGLEAVGPAAGMLLTWAPTVDGAEFVLFAEHGARIPPTLPNPWESPGVNVLGVTVAVRDGQHAPERARLLPLELFGADSVGNGVPGCPMPMNVRWDPSAHICAERRCDANGDGRSDVTDLVRMLLCLHAQCPDSAGFDCDESATFTLDDILCCARRMLRQTPPDTSQARLAPEVAVSIGTLRQTATGWALPVTLRGARSVGAARLDLAMPSDRFTVTGVGPPAGHEPWLGLHEMDGEALVLGLLNLAQPELDLTTSDEITVEVQLALKPGQSAGGTFTLMGGDFSGTAGEPLKVTLPVVGIPARTALSAPRPNPFSSSTTFALDVDREAMVEVSVLDLAGRRVALLHRGVLPAGRREFTWTGLTAEGREAPGGVYFVKCRVGGRIVSQKLALLRGR